MNPKLFSVPMLMLAFALAGASIPPASASDTLIQVIPTPDLSKLPAARAEDVRKSREAFDKAKVSLVGKPLADAHALIGAIYARNGLYDAAAIAFDDASALSPQDGRWLYARGLVARMQKRDAEALTYFERALGLDTAYLPIRVATAAIKIDHNEFDAARKLLSDYTAKQTNQAVPFAMLGDIALRQKRYADAIEQFNLGLKADPKANALYAQLADAYTGAGDAKAAADARAKAGKVTAQLGDPIGLGMMDAGEASAPPPRSNLEEAASLLASRQYAGARQKLDLALKDKPNDVHALDIYARVEGAAGNVAQAQARANAAVSAAPNDAGTQTTLGIISEIAGDDAAARRAYEKAVSLNPKAGEARLRLGNVLMRAHQYDQAATQYRALAQADSENGESWMRLVAANVAAGRCADALKDINAGLAKNSKSGLLMQLFIRTTSTCGTSGAAEKKMALDYGIKQYKQTEAAPVGEAFALALAANGKWDDAVSIQEAAMFVLVRNGRQADVADYRLVLKQMQSHQLPDRPWPATSELFNPPRATPDVPITLPPMK